MCVWMVLFSLFVKGWNAKSGLKVLFCGGNAMSGQSSVFKILVRMICIQKIRTVLKQTSVPIQRFILVILNCILLYTHVY